MLLMKPDLSPEYLASLKSRLKGLAPILPRDCIASEAVEAIDAIIARSDSDRTALRQISKTIIVSECQNIAKEALTDGQARRGSPHDKEG
jgi:hypothetical protein